jgi:hypothetical protein
LGENGTELGMRGEGRNMRGIWCVLDLSGAQSGGGLGRGSSAGPIYRPARSVAASRSFPAR